MNKLIDKAFAKAYARRRTIATAPPNEPTVSEAQEIQRAEEGRASVLPAPHLGLPSVDTGSIDTGNAGIDGVISTTTIPVEAGMAELGPDTVPPAPPIEAPVSPGMLHAMLCSVTDVVATTWTAAAANSLPELPPEAESAPSARTKPAPMGPAPTEAGCNSTPAVSTIPPTADASPALPATDNDLLEGLKRAVDAVKQTDDRLRRAAASSQMFVPLWEVDRFQWPDVVLQLEQRMGTELKAAAEGMLLASCRGIKTLGLTAATVGRGTSTITLLLAKALIGIGGRVALVDAAGTLAGLAELCGIEAPYGWNTALIEDKPLEEGATLSTADSSVIISWAPDTMDSLDRLPPDRLAQAWKRLQSTYDMTLVDLPPIDAGAIEALRTHQSLCDAVLLVQTPVDDRSERDQIVQRIRQTGRDAVGIVQNGYTGPASEPMGR